MSNEGNEATTETTKKTRKKPMRMEKVSRVLLEDGGRTVVLREEQIPGFNKSFTTAIVSDSCPFLAPNAAVEVPEGCWLELDGAHTAALRALKGALKVSAHRGKLEADEFEVDSVAVRITNSERYGASTFHSVPDFGATNGFNLVPADELQWEGDALTRVGDTEIISPN